MNRVTNQEQQLWISQDFYIPVDEQGHCLGKYYEGAMGIVVEIRRNTGGSYALKIPWLMGDTVKENAYVAELLTEERNSVLSVFSDCNNTSGLMHAEVFGSAIIQKPIQTMAAPPEAQAFHNASIAIQFRKGKSPRFCAIHPEKEIMDRLKVFPDTIEDCPFNKKDVFEKACRQSKAKQTDWSNIVGVNLNKDRSPSGIITLKDSLKHQLDESTWYLGVPAVIYVWGSSTLHEAISEGNLADWHLEQHLSMLERIVSGVASLHKRGFLHTDIRPANIMSRGECKNPENYYLIDYAGYNVGLATNDQTTTNRFKKADSKFLGPSIGGERQSPFYAPEREKGIEKEGADIAVILDKQDHYLIMFGWRNRLLENNGSTIKEEYLNELEKYLFDDGQSWGNRMKHLSRDNNENDILLPGDRLQIREFIFRIESIGLLQGQLKGVEVYRCSKNYYKIYHNRIVAGVKEPFSKQWIAIPRVIELRQWAAGTDIYGIGALFLYTMFRTKGDGANEMKIIQDLTFQRLLEELSNPHYLDTVWYELSRICTQLSICHSQLRGKNDLKKILFKPDEFWDQSKISSYTEGKSIETYAKYVTNLITHTAPDSIKILQNLEHNYVYFLYVVYFTLCCLHRQQAMSITLLQSNNRIPAELNSKDTLYLPFCASRTTQPDTGPYSSPIDSVQLFLKKFRKIVESSYFDGFILQEQEDIKPENSPAPLLRREIGQLKAQNSELSKQTQNLSTENEQLKKRQSELETLLQDMTQKLDSIDSFAGKLNKKVFYKNQQVEDLVAEISNLKTFYKN